MVLENILDREHLVIASGNRLYVLEDNGKLECFATRPNKITGLTIHNGNLFDSGNYNGIYNSNNDDKVKVSSENYWLNQHKWKDIASYKNSIIGISLNKLQSSGHVHVNGNYSLFDINNSKLIRGDNYDSEQSFGRSFSLDSNGQTIIESGKYSKFCGMDTVDKYEDQLIEVPEYINVRGLRSGTDYTANVHFVDDIYGNIRDVKIFDGSKLLIADNKKILSSQKHISELSETINGDISFRVDNDKYDLISQFEKSIIDGSPYSICSLLSNWHNVDRVFSNKVDCDYKSKRQELWTKFIHFVRNNDFLHTGNLKRIVKYDSIDSAVKNFSRAKFNPVREDGLGNINNYYSDKLDMNAELLGNFLFDVKDKFTNKYTTNNILNSIAVVNNQIYFATSKKEIGIVLSGQNYETVNKTYRDIGKMITIPNQVYESGIRQKIAKNKQRRASFANKSAKKVSLKAAA